MAKNSKTRTTPFTAEIDAVAAKLPASGTGWLAQLRETGAEAYRQDGLPGPKVESWKYTNLNALRRAGFAPAETVAAPQVDRLPDAADLGLDAYRAVLVNGRFRPDLSDLDGLPKGAAVFGLADALDEDPAALQPHLGALAQTAGMPLLSLNTAFLADGLCVRIAPGTVVDKPVHLVSIGVAPDGQAVMFHPRLLVLAGEASQVTLVESHIGAGGTADGQAGGTAYFSNIVAEIAAAESAVIRHYKRQQEAPEAFHVAATAVDVADKATYESFVLQTGGRLARNEISTRLGTRSECRLNGAYMLKGSQHADNTTLIDHVGTDGTSRELYKGVLEDTSHGVFQGKIMVRPEAQRTDGHQLNRALLLTRGAEVNSKPELEIYADDVKCAHGATVGELEEDALFYLRARGIDEATARALLVRAFIAEAVDRIEDPNVREAFQGLTQDWLEAAL